MEKLSSLISIITPCYNATASISQTIESVIAQTYQNWEMIIIDDCSSDNSAEIIHHFCERDKRIRYFRTSEPSGSPSLPRNIGIDNANGDYIAFLDSDDVWLPDKLKEQMAFMVDNDYKFVYSDYEKMDENGNRNRRLIIMPKSSSYWDVVETCTIPCLTAIMTREIIGDTRFLNIPKEDFAFWLEILKKNIKAYNTGKVHALYREQRRSRSANKFAMLRNQWYVLRYVEGIKPIIASYFMIKFLFYGFLKYLTT